MHYQPLVNTGIPLGVELNFEGASGDRVRTPRSSTRQSCALSAQRLGRSSSKPGDLGLLGERQPIVRSSDGGPLALYVAVLTVEADPDAVVGRVGDSEHAGNHRCNYRPCSPRRDCD